MGKKMTGVAMLTLASLIWGTSLVAQSVGMDHVGPFTFNAVRFLIGAAVLLPFMRLTTRRARGERAAAPRASNAVGQAGLTGLDGLAGLWSGSLSRGGLLCGAVLFATASLQQIGIMTTSVGKVGFITALYIVMVPVLGLFLGRRVPRLLWACIALAMAGMYLLCMKESLTLSRGDAFVLLSACATSAHILLIAHFSPLVDGVKLSCLQFLVCGALSGVVALAFERPDPAAISGGAIPILYAGVLSCGVAYTLQTLGQKTVNPVIASLIVSLESVFGALSGWIGLGEVLSGREIAGCVLIFAAILLAQIPELLAGTAALRRWRAASAPRPHAR